MKLTTLIIAIILIGGYFLFTTSSDKTVTIDKQGAIQTYFNKSLEDQVINQTGQPIEGFRPFMFMKVLSELVEEDFDGVDALLGRYEIVEKQLIFVMDETDVIHSAAEAISKEGMKTLFENIQKRTGIEVTTAEEVDALLVSLGASSSPMVTECLPEQRNAEACIEIYQPVCGLVNVECVTEPCPPLEETFSNSCKACSNSLVSTYTEGECLVK